MPELPEVETTVRGIKKKVLGRTFFDVWSDHKKMIRIRFGNKNSFKEFKKQIKNKKVKEVYRRGKNIIFELPDSLSLLVHQKMTGHFLYGKWKFKKGKWIPEKKGPLFDKMNSYIHLMVFLDNGKMLALSDLRKFAKVELWKKQDLEEELKKLGPEPLKKNFTFEKFKEIIKKRKGKIKQVLMKQEVISGIGNIYSDEILWKSKIHPERKIKNINLKELKRIFKAMKNILKKGIKAEGESFSDYRKIDGKKGNFDKDRKVYQREGEKCSNCKTKIKRIKVGQRSSHFCPSCQK